MDKLEILTCLRKISSVLDASDKVLDHGKTECFDDIIGAVNDFSNIVKDDKALFSKMESSNPDIYRELIVLTDSIKNKVSSLNGKIEIWKTKQLELISKSRKSSATIGKYGNGITETSYYYDSEAD